ncbi:MAG: CaiB/BaiF CoA transferase family protein [Flavobacteriaceae bacterium]
MPEQPLKDIRVLDFSTLLPGPLAGLILAEAGADVVKIERPGGEEARGYRPRWGATSAFYALLNRGKTMLAADLKSEEGKARILDEVKTADVLIEQFRPGVMERLGLGYEALREINPRLVYCSITGYGQEGPRAAEAGHDLNYVGNTGVLAQSYGHGRDLVVPPALVADIGGGTLPAVINILLALFGRERSGEGARLDIAMADAMFTFSAWAMGCGATGAFPGNGESMLTGGSPRYRLYRAGCGRAVAVAALEQKFWETFCGIVGLDSDLADDTKDPEATRLALVAIIGSRPASEWAEAFAGKDCCASVVRDLEEAMRDEHFVQRGLFRWLVRNEAGETMTALPVPVAPCFRSEPGAADVPALDEI